MTIAKYQTFFISRPSKICPNWVLWFEKIASGNPGPFHRFSTATLGFLSDFISFVPRQRIDRRKKGESA
jgi:hypothetical protein